MKEVKLASIKTDFTATATDQTKAIKQYTSPKEDTLQQRFRFSIGKYLVTGSIQYTFMPENIGGSDYLVSPISLAPDKGKLHIPNDLKEALLQTGIWLDKRAIQKDTLEKSDLVSWIQILDANMDGVEDIGVLYDVGTKNRGANEWVNLRGKLVQWHGGSQSGDWERYNKERIVLFGYWAGGGEEGGDFYRVTGDTTLVPYARQKTRFNKKSGKPVTVREKYINGRWIKVDWFTHAWMDSFTQ